MKNFSLQNRSIKTNWKQAEGKRELVLLGRLLQHGEPREMATWEDRLRVIDTRRQVVAFGAGRLAVS